MLPAHVFQLTRHLAGSVPLSPHLASRFRRSHAVSGPPGTRTRSLWIKVWINQFGVQKCGCTGRSAWCEAAASRASLAARTSADVARPDGGWRRGWARVGLLGRCLRRRAGRRFRRRAWLRRHLHHHDQRRSRPHLWPQLLAGASVALADLGGLHEHGCRRLPAANA